MILSRTKAWWRAGIATALSAVLGFSYSLATLDARDAGVASRASIQTNVTRPPAEFITDSDLGVVVVGSQFTRQILVRYGFKPHLFTFGNLGPESALTISDSGTLAGAKDTSGTEQFDVQEVDLSGNQAPITKRFSITAVDAQLAPAPLQFANSTGAVTPLPDALTNEMYSFTLSPDGGHPPYILGFASDADFSALPAGLTLDFSGKIYGRPVAPTPVGKPAVFTVLLTDANYSVTRQTFSLNVLAGTISSQFVATSGAFKLNFGAAGKDQLSLTLLLNKTELAKQGIRTVADLNGVPFVMQFGGCVVPPILVEANGSGKLTGASFPTTFDKNGTIRFPNVRQNILPSKGENTTFTIALNPATGVLRVVLNNVSLVRGLDAEFNTFANPIIPVNIKIGQNAAAQLEQLAAQVPQQTVPASTSGINYDQTDTIQFVYKRVGSAGKGTAAKSIKLAPGGLFLVSKALGTEAVKGGGAFDQVAMQFSGYLRLPGGEPFKPVATDNVSILLGTQGLGGFPASSFTVQGDVVTFANTDRSAPLKSVIIDNKRGTFVIQTFPMDPRLAFGVDVLNAGTPFSVPLTLTIATPGATAPTFDGQASMTIFRKGSKLLNK